MSLDEVAGLRRMLAERPPAATIEERRANFQAMAARFPLPEDVDVEPAELAPGLVGRWVRAPDAVPGRCVLYLHGGAFVLGSSTSYRELAGRISRAAQVEVFVLDYALAPERPFPAARDDVLRAAEALANRGGFLALAGDSAGANLALTVAQERPPDALWLISAYLDLTHSGSSVASRESRDPFVRPETMPMTATTYAGTADPADPRISPLFGPVDHLPPTLIQVGADEVLFDDSRRLRDRMEAAGRPVVFQEWAGMIHAWPLFGPMIEEGRWAVEQGGVFLRNLAGD